MRFSSASALLGLGALASAANQQQCVGGGVCYTLNIPDATASSGKGDIYMRITGPTSYSWIGLGQGAAMPGAQFFLIYASADGKNVTLSPRLSSSYAMPQYNSAAQAVLLEGSGIANGQMTANIKCSSCSSWNGGSMDFTSSSLDWIYAALPGSSLNSDDKSARLSKHTMASNFAFGASAKGGSSTNPFLSAATTNTASSPGASVTSSGSTAGGGQTTTTTTTTDESGANDAAEKKRRNVIYAHAALAGIAFVALFPIGAIVMRLLSFKGVVALHVAFQATALVLFITAFGLGVWFAKETKQLNQYHPIIGIIVFCLVIIQPILGTIHHRAFQQTQRRTIWSQAHIWLGRIVITLGMINGGLGLLLAEKDGASAIAYGVIAAFVWLVWVVAIFIGERKRVQAPREKFVDNGQGTLGGNANVNGMSQNEYYGNGVKA